MNSSASPRSSNGFPSWAWWVLGIALVAIALRLALAALIDWRADFATGDSGWYLTAELGDAFRAPGYVAFIRAVGPDLVLPAQAMLTLAGAALTWLALKDFDGRLAAVSAAALALSPIPVPMELRVLSETLYGFLVLVALLVLFQRPSIRAGIISGIAMGAAMLTRDSLLLLPLFVLPFLPWRQGLAFAAAAYLLAAPWYLTHPGEGRAGFVLWIGTWERNPDWQAAERFPDYAFRSDKERVELTDAFRRQDYSPFASAAFARMKEDPAFVVQSWVMRYPRLWLSSRTELNTISAGRIPIKLLGHALNTAVILLGIWGMCIARREYRIFMAPVAYGAIAFIPLHNTEPRYILFAMPFLLFFASIALLRLVDHFADKGIVQGRSKPAAAES